ncbi:hypothetical protein Ccrd_015544 [Cynara cardunculus var. scolymus]|uniref:Transmembrane protein n=1 Tax=Cynara cardunculus var. scolymus TaxID=59895 RepID=A0A103YBP3_CYNCS|nr:hypothetical protein Ccrd_015544 [Cynara cardunculus var. scolymus]
MERIKLNILCWLLIVLFSSQIPSRLALGNAAIERSKSLALVQESRGLETITWNSNQESMKHDMMSIAKGQKGGRGSGGGSINHTPRKNYASTKVCHHMIISVMGVTLCILGLMVS